jgi:hypothetical protein
MAVNEFEEFRKQYEKTFIRIKFESSKDYHVVSVRQCVADDDKKPYIVVHNPKLGQCAINWNETKQDIDYSFPQIGLFNHRDRFLMFHRFPDRQWKRGVSSGNSHIADPLRDILLRVPDLRGMIHNSVSVDYPALTSAYHPDYPTNIDEALERLEKPNQLGICLNPVFGITKNPTKNEDYLMWKHLSIVGTLNKVVRTIRIEEPTFRQEVIDYINRSKEHTWSLR